MEQEGKSLSDYLGIAKRRSLFIAIPFLAAFGIAVAISLLLPPIYQSKATILIESQQVPFDLIQTTVTSFAEERIQVIKQRVLSSNSLVRIMGKHGLFREERKTRPQSELLENMRRSIAVERVRANVINRGGRSQNATIAFTVSFDHELPRVAQAVANELVTMFLEENTRTRTENAAETANFITAEVDKQTAKIRKIEDAIKVYKTEFKESLPENQPFIHQSLIQAENSRAQVRNNISALETREVFLKAQLSAIKTQVSNFDIRRKSQAESTLAGAADDPSVRDAKIQLTQLRNRYLSLVAVYGDAHPDVTALQRQITVFKAELGGADAKSETIEAELKIAQESLANLKQKYSDQHPDVVARKRQVAKLEVVLEDAKPETLKIRKQVPEAPTVADQNIIQLEIEVASIPKQIEGLKNNQKLIERRIKAFEKSLQTIPQVSAGLTTYERNYADAIAQYNSLKSKQQDAVLAQSLEQERKGERFTLLEPPIRPDKPEKPDRIKILILGIAISAVVGFGTGFGVEALDKGVRGVAQLTAITHTPPMAVIPYLETNRDRRKRLWKISAALIILVILIIGSVVAVHFFVKPLDLLWPLMLRRFGIY